MRWMLAVVVALGVFGVLKGAKQVGTSDRIAEYLGEQGRDETRGPRFNLQRLAPSAPWVATGVLVGLLVAQGDLFLSGPGRSIPALGLLGGAAGWFLFSARQTSLRDNRIRTLRFELPIITDALAMQVVSGESVATSIASVCSSTQGAASEELAAVLDRSHSELSLPEALAQAAAESAHPDGTRLYETLAHAHEVGGRLSESLADLGEDFRASLERDLTAEGGKRAISTYGPVIALMVPTALLFLLYPTLLGLRALSGAP